MAVDCAVGASVVGMVGEAGIWIGAEVAGIIVFVGRGAGLVDCGTGADILHANDTKIKMDGNRRIFFTIVLCMVAFPFMLDHSHYGWGTPLPLESVLIVML